MKITAIILSSAVAAALTSCNQLGGNASNPYGAPSAGPNASGYGGANPYAAPQSNGETGAYSSNTAGSPEYLPNSPANPAPYQPIPASPNPPSVAPSTGGYAPAAGGYNPAASGGAIGATTAYTVAPGDSLWGLSRKFNTTVQAIQQANGMSDTVIRVGETLQIPAQ